MNNIRMIKTPFPPFSRASLELSSDFSRAMRPTDGDRQAFQDAKAKAAQIPGNISRLHFKFDRTLTGEQLASALKTSLSQQGINPDDVLIRFFSKNRLIHALQNGSDRDASSNVDYNGSDDGEVEWMQALGIRESQNVTFVRTIGNRLTGGVDAPNSHDNVYVLFDKRFLYKVGHKSNGFHAFLTPPSKANIGFISDLGNLQLIRADNFASKPEGANGPD